MGGRGRRATGPTNHIQHKAHAGRSSNVKIEDRTTRVRCSGREEEGQGTAPSEPFKPAEIYAGEHCYLSIGMHESILTRCG